MGEVQQEGTLPSKRSGVMHSDLRSYKVRLEHRVIRTQGPTHYLLDYSSMQVNTRAELTSASRRAGI